MTTLTDDEIVARLRASLDELTAGTPADAPSLEARPTYVADVVPFRPRRRWAPVMVAAVGVAATVTLVAVLATRGGERVPVTTDPTGSVSSVPPSTGPTPVVAGALPVVTLEVPGAATALIDTTDIPAPDASAPRVYATPGVAPEGVLVVETTQSQFDPPSPEGDYAMDPVSAPSGQAWILRAAADETGNHSPSGDPMVWWSTGNGRELVKLSGWGLTDAELIAVLPDLRDVGPVWDYEPTVPTDLQPVVRPPVSGTWRRSETSTVLADGQTVTVAVETGFPADLLQQAAFWRPPLDAFPATVTLPDGTVAIARSDPGAHHLFWRSGDTAVVHLTVPFSVELAPIAAAVRTVPA